MMDNVRETIAMLRIVRASIHPTDLRKDYDPCRVECKASSLKLVLDRAIDILEKVNDNDNIGGNE